MKARITQLNAPWPSGAAVGDVIELPAVPAWAVGKCEPAPDDAEVTVVAGEELAPSDAMQALRAEVQGVVERLRAEHAAQVAELQGKVSELSGKLAASDEAKAAAEAQVAELQGKLAAAATPAAPKKKA